MIKSLLHRMIRRMEGEFAYDAEYMHAIVDGSTNAGLRLLALPLASQYRGPSAELWAGASLASTLDGDCGPCAQLVVDMVLKSGIHPVLIRACLARDFEAAGTAGLGFRFAEASIRGDLEADALREKIEKDYGAEAVIAAAFAAAISRSYPVLKRALGHGAACQRLQVGGAIVETTVAAT